MKNRKSILIVSLITFISLGIYLIFFQGEKDIPQDTSIKTLSHTAQKITTLLAFCLFPGSGESILRSQLVDSNLKEANKRMKYYNPIIKRLIDDPKLKQANVHPLQIYLTFLNGSLINNDSSIKNLIGRPGRKILRRILPFKLKSEQNKKRSDKIKWKNPYRQFLTAESINKGLIFLKNNDKLLNRIEKKYRVSKEYLVSILFIETKLGTITGEKHVLSVYNTLYHYDNKNLFKKVINQNEEQKENKLSSIFLDLSNIITYRSTPYAIAYPLSYCKDILVTPYLPKPGMSGFSVRKKTKTRKRKKSKRRRKKRVVPKVKTLEEVAVKIGKLVERKREWGYKQIRSLILINSLEQLNINDLKGSWAGAFGYCQFIPSSYLIWAQDGNSDGVIDLYTFEDALASTANYLKKSGFKPGNRRAIKRSILRYNLSSIYVSTVYNYARSLQIKTGRQVPTLPFRRLKRLSLKKKVRSHPAKLGVSESASKQGKNKKKPQYLPSPTKKKKRNRNRNRNRKQNK